MNTSSVRDLDKSFRELAGLFAEGLRGKGLELVPHTQDRGSLDSWDKSKFDEFSRLLGFSTKGMEKTILKFFQNIWSKREKILDKESLEKTRSVRELKRLECSINYKGAAVLVSKHSMRGQKRGLSMILKLVSRNVSGANDSSKRKIVKALLRSQRLDLFCLQETKMRSMSKGIVKSLGSRNFLDWEALVATSATRRVLIVWDRQSLALLDKEVVSSQFCVISKTSMTVLFGLSMVYMVPLSRVERDLFWDELGAVKGLWEEPWFVRGDFNVISSPPSTVAWED